MKTVQIFDPALCCNSGVCGVDVDQDLVTVAADIDWAKRNGARIDRFNLAQQPGVFAEHPVVREFLERSGHESLPLILVQGQIALAGRYPTREEIARWTQVAEVSQPAIAGSCCSGSKCC